VGEVQTVVPLVRRLREVYPNWDLRISVSTFTGFEVARSQFPDLTVFYFPVDLSPIVARFFRRHRPTVVVLVELELWPNFLIEARRRGVPVLVANARITERSSRRYGFAGALSRGLFRLPTAFGAQGEDHRRRFLDRGVDPERVELLGNLKHDREPGPAAARGPGSRERLGWREGETLVITAGSTHPGEERIFCALAAALGAVDPRLRWVLVPRHVERLSPAEVRGWGVPEGPLSWSAFAAAGAREGTEPPRARILIVDTVGELECFYALADLVFIGGSIVPHGGHNLFEAARLGKPLLFGPHVGNFRAEAEELLAAGAARRVEGADALRSAVEGLLENPELRREMGERAGRVARSHRGALERHVAWIQDRMRLYLPPGGC
jgi:3-deoxy-D-manno-octulosonic-acid transferase